MLLVSSYFLALKEGCCRFCISRLACLAKAFWTEAGARRKNFETAPNRRASFLRAFLGLALQRRHHFIHSAERTTAPASLEILKAFGETAVNDGLWSERNLAFLYAGLEYFADVHASLLNDLCRLRGLTLSIYLNASYTYYKL